MHIIAKFIHAKWHLYFETQFFMHNSIVRFFLFSSSFSLIWSDENWHFELIAEDMRQGWQISMTISQRYDTWPSRKKGVLVGWLAIAKCLRLIEMIEKLHRQFSGTNVPFEMVIISNVTTKNRENRFTFVSKWRKWKRDRDKKWEKDTRFWSTPPSALSHSFCPFPSPSHHWKINAFF